MNFWRVVIFMSFLSSNMGHADKVPPKVVVIGGGLAGLTTASRLHQQGIDVELYEARSRVGGRVLSAIVCGEVIEFGGQNVTDGGGARTMRELIDEYGLELTELRVSLNHSLSYEKKLIPTEKLLAKDRIDPDTLKARLEELKSTANTMHDVLCGLFEEGSSSYKFVATRLAAYEGGTVDRLSPQSIETLFHMLMGGLSSVHKEDEVDLVYIKGGNSLLPERLAQSLEGKIHLNKPVTKISKTPSGTYHLEFVEGEPVQADIVVLAIPCGTLENVTFCEEIISKNRLDAMRQLAFGTNAKIFVPFEGVSYKKGGVVEDQVISSIRNQALITMYLVGETSRFKENEVDGIYTNSLPIFGETFKEIDCSSKPAVYAQDATFAKYDCPVGYSWPNDPYAKGSYSFLGAGQEELLGSLCEENEELFKTLFAPIDGTFYFIGEHTTVQEEIRGTMEAACESGARCARAILRGL